MALVIHHALVEGHVNGSVCDFLSCRNDWGKRVLRVDAVIGARSSLRLSCLLLNAGIYVLVGSGAAEGYPCVVEGSRLVTDLQVSDVNASNLQNPELDGLTNIHHILGRYRFS